MHNYSKLVVASVFVFICLVMSGCYQMASVGASLVHQGVMGAAGAVGNMENVDVKAALGPSTNQDAIKNVKKIAVVLSSGTTVQSPLAGLYGSSSGDVTSVMTDNIQLELTKLGFEVVENTLLKRALTEQNVQLSDLTESNVVKVGKAMRVDAIVLCNVTASSNMKMNPGFMGFGSGAGFASVQMVTNATMKMVGVANGGRIMMIVSLSYKNGQKPTEASSVMALALAERVKNPSLIK